MRLFALGFVAAAGVVTSASADFTTFRDWVDLHGFGTNAESNEWCGTAGLHGPLMSPVDGAWKTMDQQYGWPMIGPIVNPGEYGGTAGPATFAGLWGRPGPNYGAVLNFCPQESIWIEGMNVQSELIANGMSGDGVTITVIAEIDGHTQNLGTVILANTTEARLDFFSLGGLTQLNAGDRLSVIIDKRESFLYDHVNFNAWVHAPGPGAIGVFGAAGLLGAGRRRRA